MLEEKDYVMRIVHEWIRTLVRLIFNKDIDREEDAAVPAEMMEPFARLKDMIDRGEINEAENLLVDGLDPDSRVYFQLCLMFYEQLGAKPDEFLEAHDYSRQEVVDGLKYVVDYYGYGSLMDTFTEEL